jgi:hypothetical protein
MELPTMSAEEARFRTIHFLTHPQEWKFWPFLPLIRRSKGREELGVVYDALHAAELPGLSCTVYLENLFLIPTTQTEFLELPHETYDTPDELVAAGWCVD